MMREEPWRRPKQAWLITASGVPTILAWRHSKEALKRPGEGLLALKSGPQGELNDPPLGLLQQRRGFGEPPLADVAFERLADQRPKHPVQGKPRHAHRRSDVVELELIVVEPRLDELHRFLHPLQ